MAEATDFSIFKSVFFYSILILLLPVVAFFVSKLIVFDAMFSKSDTASNVTSAIIAVVVLHGALGLFIYKAYSDPEKGREKKDDKID
ncbi:vacuolar ATPase assembly integral membrane protein VMA21 homolog [Photinus pyralis]|uniref:vacuolar ATPase assembly integral membrane protein VMA21 homolog n=1 Tax=Photinus pyralis TaxID=7054 RepID=UPI00126746B6|nr:vacuolar ATPase assembly integral membrane protein VMA21 homolog [Photinus pyralis]XP_031358163.1 vacuolar ATPase assembly integral membrane protein VMA21 homolog [Photinus pyralis]